jgi:hypothetical protein
VILRGGMARIGFIGAWRSQTPDFIGAVKT